MLQYLLTLSLLVNVVAAKPDSAKVIACDAISGADTLLRSGNVLLLGELHGTNEAPRVVSDLVCLSLKRGLDVTVALEIPVTEEDLLSQFLASSGSDSAREQLLSGRFWARDYQDGRASQAMFGLIESVRQLKREFGSHLDLIFIDDPTAAGGRDRFMAGRLQTAIKAEPTRIFISLTGNVHNQVAIGSNFDDSYKPMGYHLVKLLSGTEIITLDLGHTGGTAWVSMPNGFGITKMGGHDEGEGVELFDGWAGEPVAGVIYLGEISASRPAKEL